jgi:hypothetical protein
MSTTLPEQLVERFLRSIRNQFYKAPHEKLFYQEKFLLIQSITYPASYLQRRGVGLPAKRYEALLTTIIRTINTHGNLATVRSPGRYLLHAVQEHMRHHGEDYYEVGKRTRDAVADALMGLKPRTKGAAIQSANSPVAALAETHRILSAGKGGRRKASAPALQADLFANAGSMQKPARDSSRAQEVPETFVISGDLPQKLLKSTANDSNLRKSLI